MRSRTEARKRKHEKKGSNNLFPRKKAYIGILILMGLIAAAFLVMLVLVDVLPSDLTFILIALMLGILIASSILFASRKKRKRVYGILIAAVFILLFSVLTGYMGSTYAMLNNITDGGLDAMGPAAKKVDVTTEPFNLYITGIDQWANEKGLDLERSDVNMIVTVNPTTKKILLTSIPRDTYVELHTAKQMDKLTHTGIYGVDETINTVQDWLGIDMNYYVKINFTGVMMIITAMGGIDVYSPVAFDSDLKNYHYEEGWNHLYGKEALYFARERKAFEDGDAARVENQQRVMEAVIKKMTSSATLITNYGEIVDTAGEQIETNLSKEEMSSLAKMQITELASWDVEKQNVEGEVDRDYVASLTQAQKFDIYRPNELSVKSCIDSIKITMNPSDNEIMEAKKNKRRSFIINAAKRLMQKDDEGEEGD